MASGRISARSRAWRAILPLGATLMGTAALASVTPIESVDPMVGTDGHGHAFPGATMPFGMVQLSPDTRTESWDGSSGYHYSDSTILGFSHTHLSGTGVGCLGDIMLMPTVGDVKLDADGYKSHFSHANELAKAGYYKVFLDDPKVTAELTATTRAGFHRYTFPKTDHAHIVLDLDHGVQNETIGTSLKVEDRTTVSGYRKSNGWGGGRTVYFVIKFSKPFDTVSMESNGAKIAANETSATGKVKAAFNFRTAEGEPVEAKVGISAVDVEGARKNLMTEIPGWDFGATRAAAAKAWDLALGNVTIESTDPHVRRTFYSNLYLSYQAPNTFNDVDGAYMGMDHKVHRGEKFTNYSTFSLWDTYRALHPLLTILQPNRVDDMVQSLVSEYGQSGYHNTPVWPLWGNETWCMIGYHSVPVIVDAYLKGFRGFDAETAYQAMKDTAMQNRFGLDTYKKLGYVASAPGEAATSKTVEYAMDDWAIAQMAQRLGHPDDARMFYDRAANYRNLFDRSTNFLRGRKANGAWRRPFDTLGLVGDEYTESDAWQYGFAVQHDVPGLIDLYGGDKSFVDRMDHMFTMESTVHTNIPDITGRIGQYAHGNEPCHHVVYLYDYAGAPYKAQPRLREIMTTLYNDTPAGQCGNIDCGQMSAWYVFSAMGFYPVNPASGVYAIGSPMLDKVTLNLDAKRYGGHKFTVVAENNSPSNVYIQSATLNGKPYNRAWISHDQIAAGGTLKLVMGAKPNTTWGASADARPAATMPANFAYRPLPTPADDTPITLALPIHVVCGSDDPVAGFVPDPNVLNGSTNRAQVQVDTSVPNAAPAAVYASERYGSDFTHTFAVPKGRAYTVRLHFAEVFGDDAGQRLENVSINGERVLANFDPVVAAGGPNKAVVKEFKNVRPDASGNISIRIQAAPGSPDQNAKISAIEILE